MTVPVGLCPSCGEPCTPVGFGPHTPPWCCYGCRRGWWQAEVDSGHEWDGVRHGFPRGSGVHPAVKAEHAAQAKAAS